MRANETYSGAKRQFRDRNRDVLMNVHSPHWWWSHTLQSGLESGLEARIMQIDFSAAFNCVNYQGILYKLCSVGIGGSVLSIFTLFLSN